MVNVIGSSKYWNNTVIFVTWDDWGGWYDHVQPQIYNPYELGFRVPLIVISPYAKPGYVSHVHHEFGSILKFVEEQFGLGSLGYTDGVPITSPIASILLSRRCRDRSVATRYSKEQLMAR